MLKGMPEIENGTGGKWTEAIKGGTVQMLELRRENFETLVQAGVVGDEILARMRLVRVRRRLRRCAVAKTVLAHRRVQVTARAPSGS